MADTPEPKGGSGTFGFLGKKVFGKVPIWVIAVAAVGGYYWYTHYGPGKKTAAQQQQTDPAGNVCAAINPDTGYCPGSVEDTAALQNMAATGDGGTGSSTTPTPGPIPQEPPPYHPPACRPGYSFSTERLLITVARGKKPPAWYAVPGGFCTATSSPPVPVTGRPPGAPVPVIPGMGGGPVPVIPRRRRPPARAARGGSPPIPAPVRVYAPGTTGSVYATT